VRPGPDRRTARRHTKIHPKEGPDVPVSKLADGRDKLLCKYLPEVPVISGHFFLHAEPGAPFFPTSEEEARSLYMKKIPLSSSVEVDASPGFGIGELIMENAKRI
jgi:hypothetical protein